MMNVGEPELAVFWGKAERKEKKRQKGQKRVVFWGRLGEKEEKWRWRRSRGSDVYTFYQHVCVFPEVRLGQSVCQDKFECRV